MNVYDKVEKLLRNNPEYRDSDKKLHLVFMYGEGVLTRQGNQTIFNKEAFMDSTSFETIRRSRQKVVENNPELQASEPVKKMREDIERTQGDFVYMQERLI